MKKATYLLKLLPIISLSLCLGSGIINADEQVLASVDGVEITSDMMSVLQGSRQHGPLSGLDQSQKALLENLITTELLYKQAKENKLDVKKDIAIELELAHKTLLSQFYVKQYMDQLSFDETTLKQVYDAEPPRTMARMTYWPFDTKSAADTFLEKAMSEQFSSLPPGEEQPWQPLESYPFAQSQVVTNLKEGQWLPAPSQDQNKWLVWRCLEISAIPKPAFEDVKEDIRQELASKSLQKHIETLRASASITTLMQDEK